MECKNCKAPLSLEDHFCKACGGKVITEQLTFSYLGNEFSESFLNLDKNRLLQTFKDLIFKPEEVINGYIDGVRRRYLNVANYLAIAITIAGLQLYLLQKFFTDNMDLNWMMQDNNPALQNTDFIESMWEYNSLIYMLMIPLYALISKVVFLDKKDYSYLKHIVIVTYSQAQLTLMIFIPTVIFLSLGVNFFKLNYVMMVLMMLYSAYVYKRLFKLSFGSLLLKTLLFLLIAIVFYIGLGILMWIYWIASGTIDLKEFMEAERAKRATAYVISSAMNWTS